MESKFENIENIDIELQDSNDIRSYHINSDKIDEVLGLSLKKL